MPATIPENSTRGSSARIRITSCLGRKLRITATTRTLNGSGLVPEKTVSAWPTIPGRQAASGRIAGGGPEGTTALRRSPPRAAGLMAAGLIAAGLIAGGLPGLLGGRRPERGGGSRRLPTTCQGERRSEQRREKTESRATHEA